MKNQSRQHVLDDSLYLGEAILNNYCLFELGSFPGAVMKDGYCVVGEVYKIDEKTKKLLDYIEAEGVLYRFKYVEVILNNEKIEVGFYEFIDDGKTYPIRSSGLKWDGK